MVGPRDGLFGLRSRWLLRPLLLVPIKLTLLSAVHPLHCSLLTARCSPSVLHDAFRGPFCPMMDLTSDIRVFCFSVKKAKAPSAALGAVFCSVFPPFPLTGEFFFFSFSK
ncbi:hypothetical protein SODALDRAFT_327898 [Sodiomyces alkalinus F11]|uniref:Secreted protein n=1 Tax=Sodiomyces alkalinus (strain CBS 110278 / VKM F-3762 / F11) TaxID=1314773 RepID=A0A3N2QAK9_SODAK|nr:hypothetical protein SODALDRAFT_327898 [Sodiomyces alkalinus F11]ROT43695.1 hypothetical protein SODALDRAFT_327898 [Sodiomyces alkalinus F11]